MSDKTSKENPTSDERSLLLEVAKDRQKIKQLSFAKNRIGKAITAARIRVDENEKQIYSQYEESVTSTQEEVFKQLELF